MFCPCSSTGLWNSTNGRSRENRSKGAPFEEIGCDFRSWYSPLLPQVGLWAWRALHGQMFGMMSFQFSWNHVKQTSLCHVTLVVFKNVFHYPLFQCWVMQMIMLSGNAKWLETYINLEIPYINCCIKTLKNAILKNIFHLLLH